MEGDSVILQAIGRIGYKVYEEFDLVQTYSHLLLAALFPIYIGSHASLRCPPHVATEKEKLSPLGATDDDSDDELEPEPIVEGLTPSDAILFPVLAGFTLAGLYFLIKWLEDPTLLNKILGWYFSAIGVLGVGRLAADTLNVGTSFIFPNVWSAGGKSYSVDPLKRKQTITADGARTSTDITDSKQSMDGISSPLPGYLSKFKLSSSNSQVIWNVRALFTDKWILRAYVHGMANIKSRIRLNDVVGLLFGVVAITVYNLYGKAWWLTNLMGFGFCYGTLQLMSPTTFWTGSLVLMGLFVYDIVMVFYTPLMVTVATTLDVPIKLIFPGAKRGGMLGLGDVVLPGIMMALALRFDLYMHYLRKQRVLQAAAKDSSKGSGPDVKPTYYPATGFYGERFWTAPSIFSIFKLESKPASIPDAFNGGNFKKTYFHASIVGYVFGMLVTLFVLNVYKHAQPALLYLVPGVLGSLWGTSLVRSEWKEMWAYSEDGLLESGDDDKTKGPGPENKTTDSERQPIKADGSRAEEKAALKEAAMERRQEKRIKEHAHHVFLFSLSSPRKQSSSG